MPLGLLYDVVEAIEQHVKRGGRTAKDNVLEAQLMNGEPIDVPIQTHEEGGGGRAKQ